MQRFTPALGLLLVVLVAAPAVWGGERECAGPLFVHHNDTFENGSCWAFSACWPPYYGAWGEAFDLGPGVVDCGAYYFTRTGLLVDYRMDVYIWEGGVATSPGDVLCLVPSVPVDDVSQWPEWSQHDVEIGCELGGEFTIGYWVDFSCQSCQWLTLFDGDGSSGHPWTNIAPGVGYPTGWQSVTVLWPDCRSLGIGAYFSEHCSPIEAPTWGQVKMLFRP